MIYISAGHYEAAQGATWRGHTEWTEACRWRDAIVQAMGPTQAIAVPSGRLRQKVEFINAGNPLAALEIHFNSAIIDGVHVGDGPESLYHPGSNTGRALAALMQDSLARFFEPDRGVKEGWYKQDRPGVVDYHGDTDGDEKPLYFLQRTICPAVIIEPEFMHHYHEIQRKRETVCQALGAELLGAFSQIEVNHERMEDNYI